jgi:uncharacterized protein involved in type VI secretion and phage assembly
MPHSFDVTAEVGGTPALFVLQFEERARFDYPSEVLVHAVFPMGTSIHALVGGPAELTYARTGDVPRRLTGVVESATLVGAVRLDEGTVELELRIVSEMLLLEGTRTCRIFQEKSVPDIVQAVLQEHGLGAERVRFQLQGTYQPRAFCVQYNETSLAFVRRLLADEGINFFTEYQEKDAERFVFVDDTRSLPVTDGASSTLTWRPRNGLTGSPTQLFDLHAQHEVRSGKVTLRDYDFERPKLQLEATAEATANPELALYDYPGGYTEPAEGKRLAQVRLEEERTHAARLTFQTSSVDLAVGQKFNLEDAPSPAFELPDSADGFLVTEIVRTYDQASGKRRRPPLVHRRPHLARGLAGAAQTLGALLVGAVAGSEFAHAHAHLDFDLDDHDDHPSAAADDDTNLERDGANADGDDDGGDARADRGAERYTVVAHAIAGGVVRRPVREVPRPQIVGPQTARVVAPAGSPTEEIHTDEHGRTKVAFLWDRSGTTDETASAWFRTAQLQTSGSMMLPRVGWEVIVEFLEGDPDRPIVTGRLYNGMFVPPYALPEGKARTTLRSASTPGGGGSNEIRYDDRAGAEEINIRSQKATNMTAANNKTKNIGQNETQVISGNASVSIGANQTTKITKGYQHTVAASQTVSVGAARKVEINAVSSFGIGGDATITVGANQFEMDGNPLAGLLDIAAARATEFAQAKADEMIGQVEAMVQEQVAQTLGPIDDFVNQANEVGQAMEAAQNGDLSAAAHVVAGAAGLPEAGALLTAAGAPPPSGASENAIPVPGAVAHDAIESGAADLRAATRAAIAGGISSARDAVGEALGVGGARSSSESGAIVAGAEGAAGGQNEANTHTGPGHAIHKIGGNYSETSASLRVMAALNGIHTKIGGDATQTIGAAHAELVLGNRNESCGTDKTETAGGLVVITKGDEEEECASRTTMVGGAIIQLIKGSRTVTAGGPATIIGAYHKMQGATSVTFKAGISEVVIDGSGVSISTLLLMMGGSTLQLAQDVADA